MASIRTFLKSCSAWLQEDWSTGSEFIRQNSPPDEDYAKAQEELAESVSQANRRAEIQTLELIRN